MDLPSSQGQHLLHISTSSPGLLHPSNGTNGDYSGGFDTWVPPFVRVVLLGTILPGVVVLLTLLWDVLSRISWPKPLRNVGRRLWSPFRDFLTLDDLTTELGPAQTPPAWKNRTLVALSSLEAATWAALLAYGLTAGDERKRVYAWGYRIIEMRVKL